MRALVILGASLIVGCGATPPARADGDAEKLSVVRQMFAAWQALDWEKVYGLFAEDGVLQSMMHEPVVGRAAIRERLGRLAPGISRIDLKVRTIGVIDGRVFVERVDDFVYKGHAGAVPVVGVLEVEGGRINVWREYYDYAQLLKEMGVQPATEVRQ
ncbi:MAG: SgcJ/EcaC family oxidoreductase [Gammaproteobacteria bacterium]